MIDIFHNTIRWPRDDEVARIANGFANCRPAGSRGRLTRCIGAIDGTLIRIATPVDTPDRYRGRKGYCALNIIAVCDHTRKFTYVYVGPTGRAHDTGALKMSHLWREAQNNYDAYFPQNTYIIGYSGFGNYEWLLAAYKPHNLLGIHGRRRYNKIHSSTRMPIERAFGQLKGRWRILLDVVRSFDIARICKMIYVCCILHNICIERNEHDCEVPAEAFQYEVEQPNHGIDADVNDTRREQVVAELLAQY
jgi:hypothetical protein